MFYFKSFNKKKIMDRNLKISPQLTYMYIYNIKYTVNSIATRIYHK